MNQTPLTFAHLDDLLKASERGLDCSTYFAAASIERIGPLIELLIHDRSKPAGFKALPNSPEVRAVTTEFSARGSTQGTHITMGPVTIGFARTDREPTEVSTDWTAFCLEIRRAAVDAGIHVTTARGLVGALREIESNIHEHSGRPRDGLVGYRCAAGEFEFVVADSGMGMLASLRRNPKHSALTDAGLALELALTDGISRFPDEEGRGYGFRDLFRGLANLNGELRFRSGDHALLIDGTGPSLLERQLVQKTELRGFVASIVCRP